MVAMNNYSRHSLRFLELCSRVCDELDANLIDGLAEDLANIRDSGGRVFVMGVGGSAANAGHVVNDFRKLCEIEAYAPTDNVSELTARTNDEGFETVFSEYLRISRASNCDAIFILSVGGGNAERNVSVNLIRAIDEAKSRGMKIYGVVGRDGGYALKCGDRVVLVPDVANELVTPISEAFQGIVWHALVSHPALQIQHTKW